MAQLSLAEASLLRPDFEPRIEGLSHALTGGIVSPNEARAELSLPRVPNGDEPRVQQQMVPLSWEPPAAAPAPAAPATGSEREGQEKERRPAPAGLSGLCVGNRASLG